MRTDHPLVRLFDMADYLNLRYAAVPAASIEEHVPRILPGKTCRVGTTGRVTLPLLLHSLPTMHAPGRG